MNYMANLKRSKNLTKHQEYINLAFSLAEINLGSTKSNPSVGCIIEKNGSIISSGHTSLSGRAHAEFNALNKKIDFKNANLYSTLEPCTHHGKSPPCTNIIKKKGIKNVYYDIYFFFDLPCNSSIYSPNSPISLKFVYTEANLI